MAAAGGFMAGAMIGRNLDLLKKGLEEAAQKWSSVGRGLELHAEDSKTPFTKGVVATWPVLRGTVSGASVEVHVRSDAVYFARTEVITKAKATNVVVGVHLNPGGVLGYLRDWIGQDIQIGDEQFDPTYLITGKPESAAVSFLVPKVRELFLGVGQHLAGFTHENDEIKVVLNGVETDPVVIGAAVDLAAAAASWTP